MNPFDINNIIGPVFGYQLSYVEFFGTISGLISVWLATKENILTWPTGILNIACSFAIFYQVYLYSDMFLQIYFFVTSVYGWVTWKYQRRTQKPISVLSTKLKGTILCLVIVSSIAIGFLVKKIHLLLPQFFSVPASFPFADTFIAVASIVATILLANRILENWVLWIVVDIVCVFVYAQKQILFITIEYGIFLILASYGQFHWLKSYRNDKRLNTG